jgi:TetR/AcrR family transcriptional repressor of bet genes
LLDWVLATTTVLTVDADVDAIPDPFERLITLLRREIARLSGEPQRIRLFFEFWSEGIWNKKIGVRMQRELDRYREAFHPMCAAVVTSNPERFNGVDAGGLAAVVVGFIKGCAVQSMIEPHLDVAAFLRAAEALLASPAASAAATPALGAAAGARSTLPRSPRRALTAP